MIRSTLARHAAAAIATALASALFLTAAIGPAHTPATASVLAARVIA